MVGAVGGFLNQMLTYGFTVTTLMWIFPNAVRGLLVGLYAKKHGLNPVSYTHLYSRWNRSWRRPCRPAR